MTMSKNNVIVTGAAGFIGRWVSKELLDRGYDVIGIDDLSNGRRRNIEAFADDPDFTFLTGDIRDQETIERAFRNEISACIHLASKIDVQESLNKPEAHFKTNIIGTYNVLEECREHDTRLGLVGTCMVYDMLGSDAGIDETHPTKPASPYAGSKLAAENLAESYYHGYDLPLTILRPFNTYGPFQKTSLAGGVVSIFLRRDLSGETLQIFGDGTQTRDLLYVTDCARFIVDTTFHEATVGEIINAGTGNEISINELASLIASDGSTIEHVPHHHPQSEVQRLKCNPTKARDLLGWEPKVDLEEGVERLRLWMESGK